jgi:hypothetical protein
VSRSNRGLVSSSIETQLSSLNEGSQSEICTVFVLGTTH